MCNPFCPHSHCLTVPTGGALKGLAADAGSRQPRPKVASVLLLSRDGTQQVYEAELVGADKARDLAVVRLLLGTDSEKVLPSLLPVALAESTSVRVGQQVLAIG